MFFHKKYRLNLTKDECDLIIRCLIDLKNDLISQGRYTNAIDDVLIKMQSSHILKTDPLICRFDVSFQRIFLIFWRNFKKWLAFCPVSVLTSEGAFYKALFTCSLKIEYTGHKDFILGNFSYFIRYAMTLWTIYRLSENSWYNYQIAFDIGDDNPNDNDTSLRSWRSIRQRRNSYAVNQLLTTLWVLFLGSI